MVRSASGFLVALRKHRICSSAGDSGAVTVWVEDSGTFHCHFGIYRKTVDQQRFTTKRQVRFWLAEWLPMQHQPIVDSDR